MGGSDGLTLHSAAPSALGYLAQIEYALLLALRRLHLTLDFAISIETLDDIVFEPGDHQPKELFQSKHRIDRTAALTDGSPDVWKTIRNWISDAPADASLNLIATAAAPDRSAMSLLRAASRDEVRAVTQLETTARTSQSQANQDAYRAFLGLEDRLEFVSRITVIDSTPQITDLEAGLTLAVRQSAKAEHRGPLLERLRGWWYAKTFDHLARVAAGEPDRILSEELEAQLGAISRSLRDDDLPIDFYDMPQPTSDEVAESDRPFVHQLRLIALSNPRIREAIYDHNRAFAQRSRWQREKLLNIGELQTFERRLVEAWKRHCLPETDDDDGDDDDTARDVGRHRLLQLERSDLPRIRTNVSEAYVATGSLHMLADRLEIGWHPQWLERMRELIGEPTASADQPA